MRELSEFSLIGSIGGDSISPNITCLDVLSFGVLSALQLYINTPHKRGERNTPMNEMKKNVTVKWTSFLRAFAQILLSIGIGMLIGSLSG